MSYKVDIPKINPIRLIPESRAIDYVNILPRLDLMTQRVNYQKGENAFQHVYFDWLINYEIKFQVAIQNTLDAAPNAEIYSDYDETFYPMTVTRLTGESYEAYPIYQITYTPVNPGFHSIAVYGKVGNIGSAGDTDMYFIGDEIYVSDDNAEEKQLIKLEFRNTYNRFGLKFDSSYFTSFFAGLIDHGDTETENTIFQEDDGSNLTQSKSYGGIKVTLATVHRTQLRLLEKICQCDDLKVNDISVICKGGIEKTPTDKSDIFNVTVIFTYTDNDDLMNYF